MLVLDVFFRKTKRLGVIKHSYPTFNEALSVIKELWQNDSNTQYCILYFSLTSRGKIVALNMLELPLIT